MAQDFDVAVVGLGAAGAASLHALARAGVSAIGLDRFVPPHDHGASHGETRMLRVAYGEGAGYSPLAARAKQLWREIEARTGARLYEETGLVYAGPHSSPFLAETWRAGQLHGLGLSKLAPGARSGLGFEVPGDWRCILEPGAGFLYAERAIETLLGEAQALGAEIVTDRRVLAVRPTEDGVEIEADAGGVRARRAVVCAGGWTAGLLPELAPLLSVERRTIHWFADPERARTPAAGFRPFYIEDEQGLAVYGLPNWGGTGVKIGEHIEGVAQTSPEEVDRAVHAEDEARLRAMAARWFKDLGPVVKSQTCLYPMSRDQDFILDRLPSDRRITVLAGLSGHGFKFAPALGEAAAAMTLGEAPPLDLSMFALSRFAP
ncbi:MAG: N-methyl-L-tryptophan oxidase [Proteobacteria bacterium]|nr:N-methyl-L-tryptophan oxidase [Pseudomonadota bacterium]